MLDKKDAATFLHKADVNAAQIEAFEQEGSAWNIVKNGTLAQLKRRFSSPQDLSVFDRGPVGENVLHLALLFNTPTTRSMASFLIKQFGRALVNAPYQSRSQPADAPSMYEGETAIHIAIVNKDEEMVKLLIEHGADLQAAAWGKFFVVGSLCYYGEYPLSFAASLGCIDIIRVLVANGADLNAQDEHGNTALHLSVIYSRVDSYDALVDLGADETITSTYGRNAVVAAAARGKGTMFQHIYRRRRKVAWTYGPVTCYSLPLNNIDTVRDIGEPYQPTAVEMIVHNQHAELIEDPLVKTIIMSKWERFAKYYFYIHLFSYMTYLGFFYILAIERFSLYEQDKAHWVESLVVKLIMLSMALGFSFLSGLEFFQSVVSTKVHTTLESDICNDTDRPIYPFPDSASIAPPERTSQRSDGSLKSPMKPLPIPKAWDIPSDFQMVAPKMGNDPIASMLNTSFEYGLAFLKAMYNMEFASYGTWMLNISVLYYCVINIGGFDSGNLLFKESVRMISAVGMCAGCFACLRFMAGFKALGPLEVIIGKCMVNIFQFGIIFLVTLAGFTGAFLVLLSDVVNEPFGFFALKTLRLVFGMDEIYPLLTQNHSPEVETLTFSMYILFLSLENLLLLNLIISMFSDTFSAISGNAERQWFLQFAKMVLRIERTLPLRLQNRYRLGKPVEDFSDPCDPGKIVFWHSFEVSENIQEQEAQDAFVDPSWGTSEELKGWKRAQQLKHVLRLNGGALSTTLRTSGDSKVGLEAQAAMAFTSLTSELIETSNKSLKSEKPAEADINVEEDDIEVEEVSKSFPRVSKERVPNRLPPYPILENSVPVLEESFGS